MFNRLVDKVNDYRKNKDLLTLWMNNFLVLYAFLLPISQTIKATVFSFTIALFLIRGDILKHLKDAFSNKVVRAFVYLFIIYVIGMLWTENLKEGLGAIKSIKYGLYLIIFYVIVDGRYIDKVVGAFILGMLVSELTSYAMMLGIMPWRLEVFGILFYEAPSVGDPSPFLNHIHYGVALALVVVLLLYKAFIMKKYFLLKIMMLVFATTATMNIFITGGRTGYITFLLLVVILSVFYMRKWTIAFLVAMSLVFTIAYTNSPIFKQKIIESKAHIINLISHSPDYNTSLGARVGIYNYGFEIIKNNYIFGVGTGDSMDEIKNITPVKWFTIHSQPHEHNQFLSVFVKLGMVGFMIFLNIFYQIFRYKQDEKDLKFIMIFTTLAIGFGILTTQFNLRFFMPLWVVILAVTLINREKKTIQNIELNDKKQTLQIIGAGAIFSISSLVHQLM